jgi:hypothetical protein
MGGKYVQNRQKAGENRVANGGKGGYNGGKREGELK